MENELPEEFDLVVIGTGFPESCVAAAASRIGKTVLHIDPNDFYGGSWASFNLVNFCEFVANEQRSNKEIINGQIQWHANINEIETEKETLETGVEATTAEVWTQAKLLEQSRRFNIDLCPKILYSSGRLVDLLVSSNICRYAEFRAVDRVCTQFKDEVLNVPCSRSDVFNTKDLSIIEKRLLMKFLTICLTYGQDKCEEDMTLNRGKTFYEYLQSQKVTEKITTCVMQAIAMCTKETSFEEGMEHTKRFLQSLGRYGNTPFLFPMYGCGEIPQCFCRLCAVFGGIYCLKRTINAINIDADTNLLSVEVDGKPLKCKHVVSSHGNLPASFVERNIAVIGLGRMINSLSRAVFIATKPLGNEELNAGGGGVNLLRLVDGEREAILIQLSHYSGTCPKGTYIFHLTTPALSDKPESDLNSFVNQVFNDKEHAPKYIFSAYFTITAREPDANLAIDSSTPLICTAAPYYELDYDLSIKNARDIFAKIYTDAEFLPRAPDPEEIIIGDEDPRALSENHLPDDLLEQLRALEEATEGMEIEDVPEIAAEPIINEDMDEA